MIAVKTIAARAHSREGNAYGKRKEGLHGLWRDRRRQRSDHFLERLLFRKTLQSAARAATK